MFFIIVGLIVMSFVGIKPQPKNHANTFLDRDVTLSICGIFAIVIFCSHFLSYIDKSSLNAFDKPLLFLTSSLGQLMVAPFLFYSGFGVFESFKSKGESYTKLMPKNRLFKVYLSFFISVILFAIVAMVLKSEYSISDYLLSFIGIRSIGNSNWYIVVILLLYLVSYISFKINKNNGLKYAAGFIALGSFVLFIILRRIGAQSYWYNTIVAYVVGTYISLCKEKILLFLDKKRYVPWISFLSSSLLFFIFYYLIPKYICSNEIIYTFTVIFFVLTVVFFTSIFQIKNRILLFLGKNAFWIYILQRIPMIVFKHISITYSNRYVYFLLCLVVTIGIAFIASFIFNKAWNLFANNKGKTSEENNTKVGIMLSYVALGVSIVGALFITPRVLNSLGDQQYGLYSFATSITAWLTVISGALSASYLRFVTKDKKENGTTGKTNTLYLKLFSIIGVSAFIILSIVVAAIKLSGFKLSQYSDESNNLILILLVISGLQILISLIFSVFGHFNTYKRQFIFARTLSLCISIATYALNIIFAILTKSVISIAVISLCLSTITSIITMIYCRRSLKMDFERAPLKENKSVIKGIIIFSSFIILNTVVDRINSEVDKTILGIMVNAESVTIYTLAKTFNTYLLTLSVSISGVFTPRIHELVVDGKKKELGELFIKVSTCQLIILFLVTGGFIACGLPFVKMWLGDARVMVYYHAIPFLILDIVALSCNFGIEVQRAMNKHKFRAVLYIVLALMNVGISILLVYLLPKEYAIWAVTIGTVFSVTIGNWIVLNIYNHKVVGLPMIKYLLNLLKYVGITSVAVAVPVLICYFALNSISSNLVIFLIGGSIFLILYLLLIFIFDKKTVVFLYKKIFRKS